MVGCPTPERLASTDCETSCASRAARSPGRWYVLRLYVFRDGWLAVAGGFRFCFAFVSMTASFRYASLSIGSPLYYKPSPEKPQNPCEYPANRHISMRAYAIIRV